MLGGYNYYCCVGGLLDMSLVILSMINLPHVHIFRLHCATLCQEKIIEYQYKYIV